MTADTTTQGALAKLRHLYDNLKNGGVRDTAQAKRIAEGLLAPAIAELERAQAPAPQGPALVPLTGKAVGAIADAAGFFAPAEERAAFISGLRHGEAAHGITGAPNGKPT